MVAMSGAWLFTVTAKAFVSVPPSPSSDTSVNV